MEFNCFHLFHYKLLIKIVRLIILFSREMSFRVLHHLRPSCVFDSPPALSARLVWASSARRRPHERIDESAMPRNEHKSEGAPLKSFHTKSRRTMPTPSPTDINNNH